MHLTPGVVHNFPKAVQGCHTSGKSQGKVFFFKVREMSGNFEICQGKNEF